MEQTTDDNAAAMATPQRPVIVQPPTGDVADDRRVSVLGVEIANVTRGRAIGLLDEMIRGHDGLARTVFIVNAHTLNLAASEPSYREVLRAADLVFGDGTGVRWAALLRRAWVRDNLVGTDLIPALFRQTAGRGYRYFLLGGDEPTIAKAARHARETFPGWTQAGYHHGYLTDPGLNDQVIHRINRTKPHLLLVGMGNPLQEHWIDNYRDLLDVPVCMAVGGLFGYWAGTLWRAPGWLRGCGAEWLGILLQQPHKARRYLLGNPLFLIRVLREAWTNRRRLHQQSCD